MIHDKNKTEHEIGPNKSERILSPRGVQFQNMAAVSNSDRYVEPQEGGLFRKIFNTGTHAGRTDLTNAVFVLVAVLVGIACLIVAHTNTVKYLWTHKKDEIQKVSSKAKSETSHEDFNLPQRVSMDDQIDMMNRQIKEIQKERTLRKKLHELNQSVSREGNESVSKTGQPSPDQKEKEMSPNTEAQRAAVMQGE
jgi:hypothetical protein